MTLIVLNRGLEWIFGAENTVETIWRWYMSLIGNDRKMALAFTVITAFFAHWLGSIAFLIYDLTNWPGFLNKYKIQPSSNIPLDMAKFYEGLRLVLFNQLVTAPLSFLSLWLLLDWLDRWDLIDIETVPTFPQFFRDFIGCAIVYEFTFYAIHRTLHHKWIYKYIHKIHHQWTSPIALMGHYQHPLEMVLCNHIPLWGVFLFKTNFATALSFGAYILTSSCFEHCGLHVPFLMSPEVHDYHHQHFNECYSTMGLPDQIFGTCEKFMKTENAKRHKTFLTWNDFPELEDEKAENSSKV
jgi:fatty acid hydroxylase domain-containing protein 2